MNTTDRAPHGSRPAPGETPGDLHADVLAVIGPKLAGLVDAEHDRLLVARDVVWHWHRLSRRQRSRFATQRRSLRPLGAFARAYVARISGAATIDFPEVNTRGLEDPTVLRRERWLIHVAALRDLAAGRPVAVYVIQIGPGDQGAVRVATEQEQARLHLEPNAPVLEVTRTTGMVEIYGPRQVVFVAPRHWLSDRRWRWVRAALETREAGVS